VSRDYKLFIKDIIESVKQIEIFITGMGFDEFILDDRTANAVIRKLEIIGEASKNIPDHIRIKYSELPWSEMARMRDKLIHAYFGVDYEIIWRVIKERLPSIRQQLEKALQDLEKLSK
jgi:uncharacterized protein with HEPN domain